MTTQTHKSYCHLCQALCGVNVTVTDQQKIIRIDPNFDDPISNGYVCEKSQRLIGFQHNKDRVTQPLKKTDTGFEVVSWDEALDDISQRITPDSAIYMAKTDVEYASLLSYEMIKRLGINYVTNVYSMEKAYPPYVSSTMFGNTAHPDRERSQLHIAIGQNPWVTQHMPKVRTIINDLKKDSDRQLIVIDPCETATTKKADQHIQIRPGTDAWFLSALVKIIIDKDLVDHKFISKYCINFDKIKKHFSKINSDEYAEVSGISLVDIQDLAQKIHTSESVSILSGNGIDHSLYPLANNYLINLVYLLTGNFQRSGTMLLVNDVINPGMLSDCYFTEDTVPFGNQKQLAGLTNASHVSENIHKFDTVIIDNSNPAVRYPDQTKFKEQIKQVGLVVVFDSFMSETAKQADYVLPTPTFLERHEVIANTTKTAQLSFPVVAKPSGVKLNIDILENILKRRNLIDQTIVDHFSNLWLNDQQSFFIELYELYKNKEPMVYYIVYKAVPGFHPLVAFVMWKLYVATKDIDQSISLASKLEEEHYIFFEHAVELKDKINLAPAPLLFSLKLNPNNLKDDNFPYVLHCGYRQNTTMNELIKNENKAQVEISQKDADILGIKSGDRRTVVTKTAQVELECLVDNKLQTGLLRITNHAIINLFTSTDNVDYLNPQNKFVFADIK